LAAALERFDLQAAALSRTEISEQRSPRDPAKLAGWLVREYACAAHPERLAVIAALEYLAQARACAAAALPELEYEIPELIGPEAHQLPHRRACPSDRFEIDPATMRWI
jgi:hypothetical protein